MTTVTLTHDKIREAAATSPEAKKALQVLAPEAFEAPLETFEGFINFYPIWGPCVEGRTTGNFKGKGLYLSAQFDWALVMDNLGVTVLTARRKEPR